MKEASLYKRIKNNLIIKARGLIFNLSEKVYPLSFLAFIWRRLDDLKFWLEKRNIQKQGKHRTENELLAYLKKHKLYQPLIYSAFRDNPVFQEGKEIFESRFSLIKNNLSLTSGTLLDIGASVGYFCYRFEEMRFDCTAVEENRMLCYFMERMKQMDNKKFKVVSQSIFEYRKNQPLKFDVILALNIFHNLLGRKDLYENLVKLLNRLEAKELFFETQPELKSHSAALYKDFEPEQFVKFIAENSCFKKSEFLGISKGGRHFYKLTP